jgi:hypothetical protein
MEGGIAVMARRYHEIKGLAEFNAKTIVSDEEQWKKFMHTAGHMYKYPFREQMLIYAQRPDATACASLELWNEKMNCWVNKGAQGIALIDEEGVHRSGLKYVFDVKDVHEARFIGHKPKLWKMEEEHKSYEKKLNITDAEYTRLVDENAYPDFMKDKAGYGLAQWTFWSRKQALLDFAKSKGKSIGDLQMQLDFL